MANSVGSPAKSNSRLCFTFVNVTTPTAPRTPLPTKFAVAEKHMAPLLLREEYTCHRTTQNASSDRIQLEGGISAIAREPADCDERRSSMTHLASAVGTSDLYRMTDLVTL